MIPILDSKIFKNDEDFKFAKSNAEAREFLETHWVWYERFSDKDFSKKRKTRFHNRFWEMYLACTLNEFGKNLKEKSSEQGPDFCVLQEGSESYIWVEAITATPGQGPDRVPPIVSNSDITWFRVPEEQIVMRYVFSLDEKFKKYRRYVKDGTVAFTEPYIIAVNGSKVPYAWDTGDEIPYIIQAVLPIGLQTLSKIWERPEELTVGYSYRPEIIKKSKSGVPTNIFQKKEYEGISGIIFSRSDICNIQRKMGSDFIFVHNQLALNPIPFGWLKVGREYRHVESVLECRRWA
jgi:hypothetical protein